MALRMAQGQHAATKLGPPAPIYDVSGFHGTQDRLDNNMSDYFGPIANNGYAPMRNQVETYHLPDAYAGKSEYLGATSTNLLLGRNDFLVNSVLPWKFSLNQHVHWHQFQFDRTFADVSAEESIPRLVTTEKSEGSASLLRRGIALRVEHGFASTPAGRQEYELKLAAIICASSEIIHQTALLALLESPSAYVSCFVDVHEARCLYDYFAKDLFFFGCMQKNDHGFFLLDKEVNAMTNPRGVKTDTYIVPSGMSVYAQVGDASEINYNTAGPDARTNLKSREQIKTLGGKTIMETFPYELDNSMQCIDQLNRERRIGGHFSLRYWEAGRVDDWKSKYRSEKCNTDIYCAEDDSYHTITLRQCVLNLEKMCEGASTPFELPDDGHHDDHGGNVVDVSNLGGSSRMMYGDAIGHSGKGGSDGRAAKFSAACEIYAASVLGWDEKADPDGIQDDAARSGIGYFPVSGDVDNITPQGGEGNLRMGQQMVPISSSDLLHKADMFYRHGPGSLHPLLMQELAKKVRRGTNSKIGEVMANVFGTLGVSPFSDVEFLLSSAGEGNAAFRRSLAGAKIEDFFDPNTTRGALVGALAPPHLRYDTTEGDKIHEDDDKKLLLNYFGSYVDAAKKLNTKVQNDDVASFNTGQPTEDKDRFDAYQAESKVHMAQIDAAFKNAECIAYIVDFVNGTTKEAKELALEAGKSFMRQIRGLMRNNFIQALRRVLLPRNLGGSEDAEYPRHLGILLHAMQPEQSTTDPEELALQLSARIRGAYSLDNGACVLTMDEATKGGVTAEKKHVSYEVVPPRTSMTTGIKAVREVLYGYTQTLEDLTQKSFINAFANRNAVFTDRLNKVNRAIEGVLTKEAVDTFIGETVASILTGDAVDVFSSTAAARTMCPSLVTELHGTCHTECSEYAEWHKQTSSILIQLTGSGIVMRGNKHSAPAVLLALMSIMCDKVSGLMGPRIGASFTETTFKLLTSLLHKSTTGKCSVTTPGRLFLKTLCEFGTLAAMKGATCISESKCDLEAFWNEIGKASSVSAPIDGYYVVPGVPNGVPSHISPYTAKVEQQTLQFHDVVSWFALWTDFSDVEGAKSFAYTERPLRRKADSDHRIAIDKMRASYKLSQGASCLGFSSGPYEKSRTPNDTARYDALGELGNPELAYELLPTPGGISEKSNRLTGLVTEHRPGVTMKEFYADKPDSNDEYKKEMTHYSQILPLDITACWAIAGPDIERARQALVHCSAFASDADFSDYYGNGVNKDYMPHILAGIDKNAAVTYGDPCMFHSDEYNTRMKNAATTYYQSALQMAAEDGKLQMKLSRDYRNILEGAHSDWMSSSDGCPCPDASLMSALRTPEYGCLSDADYEAGYAIMSQTETTGALLLSQEGSDFKKGMLREHAHDEYSHFIPPDKRGVVTTWLDSGKEAIEDASKPDSRKVHVHQPLDAWPYTPNSFHCAGAKRMHFIAKMRKTYRSKHGKCSGGKGGSGRGKFFNELVEYMCKPLSWESLKMDIDLDRPLPVSVLCLRLWRTYKCGSLVACARGESLGRTLYGYADVQCADDVVSKTHLLHFTFQHASVVTNPDAVVTVPDVFIGAYVNGESHKFFEKPIPSASLVQERLERKGESIIPLLCLDPFYGDEVMTSGHGTGIPHPLFVGETNGDAMSDEPESSSKFAQYCRNAWNELDPLARSFATHIRLTKLNGSDTSLDDETMQMQFQAPYTSTPQRMNQFAFQEVQYMQVDNRRRYIPDKGHLPSEARRPGSAKVFNGHYAGLCRADIRETCL